VATTTSRGARATSPAPGAPDAVGASKWVPGPKKSFLEKAGDTAGDALSDAGDGLLTAGKWAWKHKVEIAAGVGTGFCIAGTAGVLSVGCAEAGIAITTVGAVQRTETLMKTHDWGQFGGEIFTDLLLGATGPVGRAGREVLGPGRALQKSASESAMSAIRTRRGKIAVQTWLNAPHVGMRIGAANYWHSRAFGPGPAPPPPSPVIPPLYPLQNLPVGGGPQ
jgi:hypothetical protein